MANLDNEVELKLGLDISGVQQALYDMIQNFQGTDKELSKAINQIEKNFKTLEAAIKRFGPTSEEAKRAASSYQNSLTQLVANGIDPASASFTKLEGAIKTTSNVIEGSQQSLKKNNMSWTNLALVIQDLPYGFRGIQNNLPALLGSFAAVTGPIYLAFSAIIAAITIWDDSLKKTNQTALDSYKKFHDVKTEMEGLSSIFHSVRTGTLSARDATRMYNEKLGELFGTAKNVYEAESFYIAKTDAYVKAQYLRAKADIQLEKAKQALAAKDTAAAEDQLGILDRLGSFTVSYLKTGLLPGVQGFWTAGLDYAKDALTRQTELVGYEIDKQDAIYGSAMAKREALLSEAFGLEKKFGIKSTTYQDELDKQRERARRKAQKQAEKDAKDYEKNQKKIQIFIAKQAAKFGELEAAPRELNAKEQEDAYYKQLQNDFNNKVEFDKKASNNTIDNLKNQFRTEFALTGNDYKAKIELQNAYLEQLRQGYMDGTIGLTEFNKARTDLILEQNKTITDAAKQNMQDIVAIGTSIMSAMGPALDALLEKGASLGEVLTQALTDILKKLIKVAIAAALTVLLLSTLGIVNFSEFGKNFATLFKSGMGFGTLDFAGAKSTAEVANTTAQGVSNNLIPSIASNSSGGRFTLRGQDLLLSMNRSEKSLNLRRG